MKLYIVDLLIFKKSVLFFLVTIGYSLIQLEYLLKLVQNLLTRSLAIIFLKLSYHTY